MKNITKDNKGITLVALIITIILLLILTSVTLYTGIDTYRFSKVNAFVAEMQLIQSKVDDMKNGNNIDELLQIGTEVTSNNSLNYAFANNEISSNNSSEYRYFTKEMIFNEFNIENATSDVMINFTTREVVSVNGIEYEGNKYYTQYKLPNGQILINESQNQNSRDLLDFNSVIDGKINNSLVIEMNGLNATIRIGDIQIINGTLEYKEKDSEYWTSITNYTEKEKEYKVNISKSGIYRFRLKDNVNNESYIETGDVAIKTANKPKTNIQIEEYNYGSTSSKDWAYAQKDGVNYVWIPRFAHDVNNNIKFVKGNSNIATDNTYIDEEKWTIPEKFTSIHDGTEFTGLWVRVNSAEQTGLVMILLLNNAEEFLIEI